MMRIRLKYLLFALLLLMGYLWIARKRESPVHKLDATAGVHVKVFNSDPKTAGQVARIKKVESKTCNIPKLDQNNPEIMRHYSEPTPFACDKKPPNWLRLDDDARLQLTDWATKNINSEQLECTLSYYTRTSDSAVKWDNVGSVKPGFQLTHDFAKVECQTVRKGKSAKWKHFFMTVVPQKAVLERVGVEAGTRDPRWSGLSVHWFSFDSLSQMAFRRSLPQTLRLLEERGAVVLNGYNIVGDGTPQAFIPILTGKSELELPLTRKRYRDANFVDVYPFVWNNFSRAGYVTLFAEDEAAIGMFTYRLKGFKEQPTDHYTRTFFMEAEKPWPRGTMCFGSESQVSAWLRYDREFVQRYPKGTPLFSVSHHGAVTHDHVTLVKQIDEELRDHFKNLMDSGAMDNSILIVGADHGHRFASFRETQQGQMEERLPFMAVHLPEAFRKTPKGQKVLANLKENANSLTTPFDMHATFLDILALPEDLETPQNTNNRSLSLLRPIPKARTCEEAGVEPHWCTCLNWQAADPATTELFANAIVDVMNTYTLPERALCAPLRLKSVEEAKKLVPDDGVMKYSGVLDKDGFKAKLTGNKTANLVTYMITFITTPGSARYEATIQHDISKNELQVDMLAISHVNKFGETPHCIIDKNYFLATYCVCYDKISWYDRIFGF